MRALVGKVELTVFVHAQLADWGGRRFGGDGDCAASLDSINGDSSLGS